MQNACQEDPFHHITTTGEHSLFYRPSALTESVLDIVASARHRFYATINQNDSILLDRTSGPDLDACVFDIVVLPLRFQSHEGVLQ